VAQVRHKVLVHPPAASWLSAAAVPQLDVALVVARSHHLLAHHLQPIDGRLVRRLEARLAPPSRRVAEEQAAVGAGARQRGAVAQEAHSAAGLGVELQGGEGPHGGRGVGEELHGAGDEGGGQERAGGVEGEVHGLVGQRLRKRRLGRHGGDYRVAKKCRTICESLS